MGVTSKNIVFDLYNTLVKIEEPTHFFLQLYKASKNGFGIELPAYFDLVLRKDLLELFRILPFEFQELFDEKRDLLEAELESVAVYDDVIGVLQELRKDHRVFLISNLASPYKKPVFDKRLAPLFDQIIYSCDCGFIKPENEIFNQLEPHSLGAPTDFLMVGDSLKADGKGAKNMGWNYVRIQRNHPPKREGEISDLWGLNDFL